MLRVDGYDPCKQKLLKVLGHYLLRVEWAPETRKFEDCPRPFTS